MLLLALVAVFSTAGNYLLELRERRSYLLACLKAKRHQARIGGEEFDVLLPGSDASASLAAAQRLCSARNESASAEAPPAEVRE